MMTKEEKLKKLEDKILDELEGITDSEVLNGKLQSLFLIAQIKKTYEEKR